MVFHCAPCNSKNGIKPIDGESKTVKLHIGQEGEFSNKNYTYQAEFVSSFGFAFEYFMGAEYKINGGDWQLQPVFMELNLSTNYTVEKRIAATIGGYSSTIYKTEVYTVA